MANAIVFDYEATPGGWFDPDKIAFDREIADQGGANVSLQVDPGHLALSARQISEAITFAIVPGHLLLRGSTWYSHFDVDFTPARLVLTGRTIGMVVTGAGNVNLAVSRGSLILGGQRLPATLQLAVTPGHLMLSGRLLPEAVAFNVARTTLLLSGRNVSVIAEQDVPLDVTRGHLALTGAPIALSITESVQPGRLAFAPRNVGMVVTASVSVTSGALILTGRDIGLFAGANLDLAVQRGALRLTGRDVVLAGNITVAPRSLVLTGHDVGLTIAGSFTIDVQPAHLVLGARELDLQISVPSVPVPPVDVTLIGGRRKGHLYPNIRFKRRDEKPEPPELVPSSVEGRTPPPEPQASGLGLVRPGVGLKERPPALAKTTPAAPPPAPTPRGISRPAPGHVDITQDVTIEVERGHFEVPAPPVDEPVAAPPRDLAADLDALTAEVRTAAALRDAEEKSRKRAERNQRAIELAIKTLLGK